MTRLAVGGIREQPEMAHLVHASDLGLKECDHMSEIGLNDRGPFLLVSGNEGGRLAGMQHVSDLLDQHVTPSPSPVPACGAW